MSRANNNVQLASYAEAVETCSYGFQGSRAFYDQLRDYLRTQDEPCIDRILEHPGLKVYEVSPSLGLSPGDFLAPISGVTLKEILLHGTDINNGAKCQSALNTVTLVVLEGFPSPGQIEMLGRRFSLRPELFLRHLGLTDDHDSADCTYTLPSLPSCHKNIAHVRMASIGQAEFRGHWNHHLAQERVKARGACRTWRQSLLNHAMYGASILRGVHLYNDKTFHVEHGVSLSVHKEGGDWTSK